MPAEVLKPLPVPQMFVFKFIASFQMTWMTSKLYKTLDDVDGVDLQLVIKLAKRTSTTHPIYNAMQKPNPS